MNAKPLPPIISAAVARQFAEPGETHAVRILLLNSVGATQYALRGQGRRKGKYLLEKNGTTGRHQLDIPVSVWNRDVPKGRYTDNHSIAHDLLSKPNPLAPFSLVIVPWGDAKPEQEPVAQTGTAAPDFFTPLKALLEKLGAPSIVEYALSLAQGDSAEKLAMFVESIPDDPSEPLPRFPGDGIEEFAESMKDTTTPPDVEQEKIPDEAPAPAANTQPEEKPAKAETPAAKRMREKRARDKAKREAEKAALQPA